MNSSKTFTIYRSSAGSGKTRTLAKEYLSLALKNKVHYFRHILAVTFANKATQEMKNRILDYLAIFANGEKDSLGEELKRELKMDDITFRQNCTELQSAILHNYDQFSISTIDAFFQKVIRSFTREAGLFGDYRLEVDQDAVLEEVINDLIDELGDKPQLTRWVVEFAKENLENDKAWDVRTSLLEFANEIFREEFKLIEEDVRAHSADPQFFENLRRDLRKIKDNFLLSVSRPAAEMLAIINSKGWVDADFSYGKNSGINGFLHQFAFEKDLGSFKKEFERMRSHFNLAKNWPSKSTVHRTDIMKIADENFIPMITRIIELYDREFERVLSVEMALRNMYVFGLLSDIARKLQDYKNENNLMLLADAPKFLNGIIQDSDTPFIYEKIGSFYRNYLIDEFQDTSGFQWKNFLPLLTNGLDQGYPSLIVGDVKQAIYRWRGGDLTLLQHQVESLLGKERVEVRELSTNFRSSQNIIRFNNALFEASSSIMAAETNSTLATSAYHDVSQTESKTSPGFVRINFVKDEEDGPKWKEQALELLPVNLELLQRQGISLNQIAILVRNNNEGEEIASYLLNYKNSDKAQTDCRYEVVSNESLRMEGASSVNLLLGALRYLLNPDDPIARAQLSFEYSKLHEPERSKVDVFAITNQVFFESQLPESFTKQKMSLKKLPLYELTETLTGIFQLGKIVGELAYLVGFQDLVLEFYNRERNDIAAFLEWWDENRDKDKTSIKISGEVDAVKVLTIHKAKGLQFNYVIVPFCAWNIDHTIKPNLWVKANEKPFDEAGFLPVVYSSTLGRTYFKEAYQQEKTAVYLDNLNILYVALSRAEKGMIITTTAASGRFGKTVGKWIYESIQRNDFLLNSWNEAGQSLMIGDWHLPDEESHANIANAFSLRSYSSSRWRDKLVIRQSGTTYFENISDQRQKINYGIHLHAVLSRIKVAEDIPGAMANLLREGRLEEQLINALHVELDNLMVHPVVGRWFEKDWEVRTEVPILLPGGEESRIDRLLLKDKKAIVVDYKTGIKTKSDQKQVLEYMEVLRKMDFTDVEGFLLYTMDQEVISLSSGKQNIVKKKNENQLGLDF